MARAVGVEPTGEPKLAALTVQSVTNSGHTLIYIFRLLSQRDN